MVIVTEQESTTTNTSIEKIDLVDEKAQQPYSLEEYFALEEKSTYKSEFINGKIVPIPMAGGTLSHTEICGNIYFQLRVAINQQKEQLRAFHSDQKIYIPKHHRVVYADACVVIGDLKMYKDGNQAILNPSLIVEVLSKSTSSYDKGGKFRLYKTIPSFTEYVVVEQNTPVVEVFFKLNEREWRMRSYVGLDKVVELESINCSLKMEDIYTNVSNLKDPQMAMDFEVEEPKE